MMLKNFFHGLIFGAGFGITLVLCLIIGLPHIRLPVMLGEHVTEAPTPHINNSTPLKFADYTPSKDTVNFMDLTIDEQITNASAIMVAEYQKKEDGRFAAIITDIPKLKDGVELYYKVGDEFAAGSYYPSDGYDRGDGQVVFMLGNPAEMRYSTTYRGGRITGLSDIPLRLFQEKCEKSHL